MAGPSNALLLTAIPCGPGSIESPREKGSELELAVHAIESTILRSSPAYQGKTFGSSLTRSYRSGEYATRSTFWVTVDIGGGYEAFFILSKHSSASARAIITIRHT